MLKPAIKGLITGALMIGATLLLFYFNKGFLLFLPYIIFGAGLIWTIVSFRRSPASTGRFKEMFNQGFRCFIVVALLMVAFVAIFLRTHPGIREEQAQAYRELLVKEGNRLPVQIDEEVKVFKSQFNTRFVSGSIFGYLIFGAIVTAFLSALLTRRTQ